MRRFFIAAVGGFVVIAEMSAQAVCIYKGKMYAKTTVAQEFTDARWVVQAKVLTAETHWSGGEDPWTVYQVQVLRAFKGKPPSRIQVFTYRNSGGFYLDRGMNADLGGVYLLFLGPIAQEEKAPHQARRAAEVNYACGQSGAWDAVSIADRKLLETLAHPLR